MAESAAIIRRIFDEVVNHGKLDVVDELYHPEFESTTQQGVLDLDGFKAFVEAWRGGFPDVHCEVGDIVADGDRIAWSVRATGTHTGDFMGLPATGKTIDFDSLNVATLRGGRLYRHKVVMDLGRMMEQLGAGN